MLIFNDAITNMFTVSDLKLFGFDGQPLDITGVGQYAWTHERLSTQWRVTGARRGADSLSAISVIHKVINIIIVTTHASHPLYT